MKYPIKVWLLTLIMGPVILVTYSGIRTRQLMPAAGFMFFCMLFGLFLSLPSLVLFWLLFDELEEREIKTYLEKSVLALAGVF